MRAFTKQNAIGIDQVDLTIGIETPHDLAAIDVVNVIDCDRAARWLHKIDCLVHPHVETFPTEGKIWAALVNCGCVAILGDAARA